MGKRVKFFSMLVRILSFMMFSMSAFAAGSGKEDAGIQEEACEAYDRHVTQN